MLGVADGDVVLEGGVLKLLEGIGLLGCDDVTAYGTNYDG